jgi:valyl-tRNA synthetase
MEDPKKEAKKKAKEAAKAEKAAKFQAKQEAKKQQATTDAAKKKETKEDKPKKDEDAPFVNDTPHGEKKNTRAPMRNSYDPVAVEAAWYAWWERSGFFKADNKSNKEKFVIVIPPPNVTGYLHMGHGLTNSVQDAIVRW